MPSPFNCLLFDLGATLIYFDADWESVMTEAVEVLYHKLLSMDLDVDEGFPRNYRAISREYYRWRDADLVETPAQEVFRKVMASYGHLDLTEGQVSEALAALYAVSQAHWQPEADALPTLLALKQSGYRIGLVSNAGYDPDVQVLVDKCSLRPALDFIVTSAACGLRKPHPHIFQLALDALEARPAETVMVGDFLSADILGANRLGMGSVWITRRADLIAAQTHLAEIQPARTIQALSELPGVLQAWDRAA